MRWPRLRRRTKQAPRSEVTGFTPGSWGAPASPHTTQWAGYDKPTGNVELVDPPVRAAEQDPETASASDVRLWFSDGSEVSLDPADPHSRALKAVADVLLHRGAHRRH